MLKFKITWGLRGFNFNEDIIEASTQEEAEAIALSKALSLVTYDAEELEEE